MDEEFEEENEFGEENLEEFHEQTLIENIESDIEDVETGRIKSPEHLQAIDTLFDVIEELRNSLEFVQQDGRFELYEFMNSKSIQELNAIFDKIRAFTKDFDKTFELEKYEEREDF